jgi:gliding motility-associated-like protein
MHVNPLPLCLSWLILLAFPLGLSAQTVLEPGDIALVGLVANRFTCGGPNGEDEVSFVCFRDIEPGTEIDFTDNGWERLNPGQWGNAEGFMRATRSGGVIPAGTVITFRFPPFAGGAFAAIAPDADWTFQIFQLPSTNNALNFNANGDQLYILQGGNWDVGTGDITNGFNHDAEYLGGRVLFGFNSKPDWNAFANTSNDSGLHPDVIPCFNMAPTGMTTDFISYTAPVAPATQLEWISRIRDPGNWTSYSDCPSYQPPPSPFEISPSNISLDCAVCQGCAPHDDTLLLNLPTTGSPFDVVYTDGMVNDTVSGVVSGDGIPLNGLLDSVTFELVAVTDANGCPVFSNFGGGTAIAVDDVPATRDTVLQLCATDNTAVNLVLLDTVINSDPGTSIEWFEDAAGTVPMANPDALLIQGDTAVYAIATRGVCSSPVVPLAFRLDTFPTLFDTLAFGGCLNGAGSITLDLTALTDSISPTPGVYLTFSTVPLNFTDTIANPQSFTYSGDTTLLVIATDPESGCTSAVGEVELVAIPDLNTPGSVFFTLDPDSGCPPLATQLTLNAPLLGEFEVVFSVGNPATGYATLTDTLSVGQPLDTTLLDRTAFVLLSADGPAGCSADYSADPDTAFADIIPGPVLSLGTLDTLCGAGTVDLTDNVQLSGDPNATVTFHTALPPDATNEIPGNAVAVNSDTVFYALATNATICADTLPIPVEVDNPDLGLQAEAITDYNGFEVSCPGNADGAAQANVAGSGLGFTFQWSNGASGSVITDLPAGTYSVTATSPGGCEQIDTLVLSAPDSLRVALAPVVAPCPGDSTASVVVESITGGAPPYEYSLEEVAFLPVGDLSLNIPALDPGTQPLFFLDANGCSLQTSVNIPSPGSQLLELGSDVTIRQGDSIQLMPILDFEPVGIRWFPAAGLSDTAVLEPFASPLETTTYTLEAITPNNCLLSDRITVNVQPLRQVYMPNAFSPNDDGRNDFLFPQADPAVEVEEFQVFDRWGTRMFTATDIAVNDRQAGWDGRARGKEAQSGVYIYYLRVRFPDGQTKVVEGDVMLLR